MKRQLKRKRKLNLNQNLNKILSDTTNTKALNFFFKLTKNKFLFDIIRKI
jgi:hypothetical protein